MIEKYFNGVIEQVFNRIGKVEKNIVLACYNNDFSLSSIDAIERYSEYSDDVFFASYEYDIDRFVGAYDPFLDIVFHMFHRYYDGDFEELMDECNVYQLHRPLFLSYYKTGVCKREESILFHEVKYEQQRMTEAVVNMLKAVTKEKKLVIAINRFQLASASTIGVVECLLDEPTSQIGIVLCANEVQSQSEQSYLRWLEVIERLEDESHVYHLGNSGKKKASSHQVNPDDYRDEKYYYNQLSNIVELLDFEQADRYFDYLEQRTRITGEKISAETQIDLFLLHAKVAILSMDLSKALEILGSISDLPIASEGTRVHYDICVYYTMCYMYQGKLEKAIRIAKKVKEAAQELDDDFLCFEAEVLLAQAKMSGWFNFFFCVDDVQIDEEVLRKAEEYNYWNHLAHIYIYAYDNSPELVAKAGTDRVVLKHYEKGMEIAVRLGNEDLMYHANRKNIMIASTNGFFNVAMYYAVQSYRLVRKTDIMAIARIKTSIGYDLSAIGKNDEAEKYYRAAIENFYSLRTPEEIAEVYYNLALNAIMKGDYVQAEKNLEHTMKIIDRLHMNSLRVCNLSKLYALLALASILQGDKFDCERYLLSCRQFLNYIIMREKESQEPEFIHDYAKSDDDRFLYYLALGLLELSEEKYNDALDAFDNAEIYLQASEGNQFYSQRIFHIKRMELFELLDMEEQHAHEHMMLRKKDQETAEILDKFSNELFEEVHTLISEEGKNISEDDIELFVKNESMARDYVTTKRQMDFIATWQKLIDVNDMGVQKMAQTAIRTFLNYFNNDNAIYIRYTNNHPTVLFNNSGLSEEPNVLKGLRQTIEEYTMGFAVSKVRENFYEHIDTISYFGADDVCSMVAVPFYTDGTLEAIFITYIQMKDNWHSSIARYMLNEDDLNIYRLLLRELGYCLNRLEANIQIYDMNRKLSAAAVTDMLTGICNRAGMYENLDKMVERMKYSTSSEGIGLMFLDLDNFKPYNDTFGHEAGDIVLRGMAKIFDEVASPRGFVSRYGGDEFIMVLNTSDKRELASIAEDVYSRIREKNGFYKELQSALGKEINVSEMNAISCSIGIATADHVENQEDYNALIQRADDILYMVKTAGKGTYRFI